MRINTDLFDFSVLIRLIRVIRVPLTRFQNYWLLQAPQLFYNLFAGLLWRL
jgi:hypothetical protein